MIEVQSLFLFFVITRCMIIAASIGGGGEHDHSLELKNGIDKYFVSIFSQICVEYSIVCPYIEEIGYTPMLAQGYSSYIILLYQLPHASYIILYIYIHLSVIN